MPGCAADAACAHCPKVIVSPEVQRLIQHGAPLAYVRILQLQEVCKWGPGCGFGPCSSKQHITCNALAAFSHPNTLSPTRKVVRLSLQCQAPALTYTSQLGQR